MEEKENTAPLQLGYYTQQFSLSPTKKDDRKARSKSIGPGGLEDLAAAQQALRDRRQSSLNATVRGILPSKEDAERKAARRRSMANRRVSFAPEATLHTWDVIEYMRDHTNSTENSNGAGVEQQPAETSYGSPSSQLTSDDDVSMSGMSDESEEAASEDGSGSEEEGEDATGTAMSMASIGETTQGSAVSGGSSTSSSLDRNLRMAARMAGTRGIEFDEYGEMSMEMAGPEVTNAFQPWAAQAEDERRGSAAYDQENMNPFVVAAAPVHQTFAADDMSMDVTRVVGDILSANASHMPSSPFAEIPMDLTQAVGGIQNPARRDAGAGQKRDHTTMNDSTKTIASPAARSKRRLSAHRTAPSPRSAKHTYNELTGQWDATMDFTTAVGGIRSPWDHSDAGFDDNEELSMELTTVIGGIGGFHTGGMQRQAPDPSSPFMIEVDPTMTQAMAAQISQEDAQSPTPRAKVGSSARRASARLRRTSAMVSEETHESSPSQGRRSQRNSAISTAAQSPAAEPKSTPDSVTRRSRKNSTPQSQRMTRSVSRSPKQSTQSPGSIAAAIDNNTTPTQQRVRHVEPATPIQAVPEPKSMLDAIKLMTTPRKETLKTVTPSKVTPSPKRPRSALRSSQRRPMPSPKVRAHPMNDNLVQMAMQDEKKTHIRLQDFLDEARIRFMDLTTSKRRLTTATTPSRLRKMNEANDDSEDMPMTIALDDAIVAAACTEPELELFKHACHELKRYIDEGRSDIKDLEAETYKETPLLIQAYMSADQEQRAVIDLHMRDIKTNARLRSKEMWYGWRSNLVDDLMKALQTIAEDLLADDETLQQKEELLAVTLPPLLDRRTVLQAQAEELSATVSTTSPEEKEELKATRERLTSLDEVLIEKRAMLVALQAQMEAQDARHAELDSHKEECLAIIRSADNAKASILTVSTDQAGKLKDAVTQLEEDYEWTIKSASANPVVLTMSYKSQLELFFHPSTFHKQQSTTNAPIGLTYTGKESPSTVQRFFLQLLRAYLLHTMSQWSTSISEMLNLIASTWDTALQLAETERLLSIEGPTKVCIQSDELLVFESIILLPAVRTKIRTSFNIQVAAQGTQCDVTTSTNVKVVYGEAYNEKNMSEFIKTRIESGFESWSSAIQQLRQKLVQQGPKNASGS